MQCVRASIAGSIFSLSIVILKCIFGFGLDAVLGMKQSLMQVPDSGHSESFMYE